MSNFAKASLRSSRGGTVTRMSGLGLLWQLFFLCSLYIAGARLVVGALGGRASVAWRQPQKVRALRVGCVRQPLAL